MISSQKSFFRESVLYPPRKEGEPPTPPPLRTAFCFILRPRTVYRPILTLRTV